MKRLLVPLICVGVLLAVAVPAAIALQTSPATREPLNRHPAPHYTDNSTVPPEALQPPPKYANAEEIASRGGELVFCKLITFADYCGMEGMDPVNYPMIHPNHQVWVMRVYWKNGLTHPKVGFIPDCTATSVFDSETGEVIFSEFR